MADETNREVILRRAVALVELARECGMVLTIETKPRQPLMMGFYDMEVSVRPARVLDAPKVRHLASDDTEGGAQ